MTQELHPRGTLYPFSEIIRATTADTTNTTIWTIPAKTIITMVLAKVVVAGSGSTTNYATVGDEDDEDGFLAGFDPNSAADTIIGEVPTTRGAYLYDGTVKAGYWKLYPAAKSMIVDCEVTTLTTQITFDVMVFGYRYG